MSLFDDPRYTIRTQAEELAASLRDFAQQQERAPEILPSAGCADIPMELLTPHRPARYARFPQNRKG
jgi:hypothetical protein